MLPALIPLPHPPIIIKLNSGNDLAKLTTALAATLLGGCPLPTKIISLELSLFL